MRKLRTFYWKVTEFLNDDKITCLQRLGVVAINGVYCRAEQYGYLYKCVLFIYAFMSLVYPYCLFGKTKQAIWIC